MSKTYEVTVTLRTGEEPVEVVYCSNPCEAITLAMDKWGELSVSGYVVEENEDSDGED